MAIGQHFAQESTISDILGMKYPIWLGSFFIVQEKKFCKKSPQDDASRSIKYQIQSHGGDFVGES